LTDFLTKYNNYLVYFEEKLNQYFNNQNSIPTKLIESMRYSAEAGGKRIRPVILLAVNDILGGKIEDVIDFAIAIELIHTYSLIHDDLPSMDNDDMRRGKPSNHKKFGEAMAILAGDALLNSAFELIANKPNFDNHDLQALKILSQFSGATGMIAGQVADIFGTDKGIDYIIENKTSKLLTAPLLIASVKNNNLYFDELKSLGYNLGKMFQITDDILDKTGDLKTIGKTPNKDKDKNNYVNYLGLEKSIELNKTLYVNCKNIVNKIDNSEFLSKFIDFIYQRKK
jgi:geranylgeranyl diphosphate synthase type II